MSYSPFDRNPSGIVFFTNGGTEPVFDSDSNFILATGSPGYIKAPNLRVADNGNIGSVSDPDAIAIAGNGNVTFSQDVSVAGSLVVNGSLTSVNTTNLDIKDSLVMLSSGTTTPLNDAGILIDRGSSTNVFMGWDESEDKFIMGTTTATSTSTGNLSITAGTLVANLDGNASTATNLQTARNFSLTGQVTATSISFNGSNNVALSTSLSASAITSQTEATSANNSDYIILASGSNLRKITKGNFVSDLGAMSNFTIFDGTTSQQIDDGETVTFADGTGAEFVVSATNTITVNTVDSEIVHDNLSGFVANEHIDHSTVSITAGSGLTGGGTIAATRTINVVGGDGITVNADEVEVTVDNSTIELSATNGTGAVRVKDGGITFAKLAGAAIQTGTEVGADGNSISDNDTSLLTAAAIINFVEGKGYSTTTGTVTSVATAGTVNGITLTGGTITSTGTITLGGTLGNITVSQLDANAVIAAGEAFQDNDTTLMTSAAIEDKILSYGYTTNTGDITGVTAGDGLTGGGASGSVTLNVGAGTGITVAADTVGISTGGVDTAQLADGAVTEAKRERTYQKQSTSTTITTDFTLADAATGSITLTLPTPSSGNTGKILYIKKFDSSSNIVTISSTDIDGAGSKVLYSQHESITVISDGTRWNII